MPSPDPSALIDACLQGDRKAQQAFYRRYFPLLLPVCLRYLGDRGEAVAVLNEAMLKIFGALGNYRNDGPFEAWLTTIVRNQALTCLKAQAREQRKVVDKSFVWPVAVPNQALDRLAVEDILTLLHRLPDHLRIVFNLVVFDGYTHAEVAQALRITETASRWRLKKSRELLQGRYLAVHPGKEQEG